MKRSPWSYLTPFLYFICYIFCILTTNCRVDNGCVIFTGVLVRTDHSRYRFNLFLYKTVSVSLPLLWSSPDRNLSLPCNLTETPNCLFTALALSSANERSPYKRGSSEHHYIITSVTVLLRSAPNCHCQQ